MSNKVQPVVARDLNVDMTKKEIADFCEAVYKDESLSSKQIVTRINNEIKKRLKQIGLVVTRQKIGTSTEFHCEFVDLASNSEAEKVRAANMASTKIRTWMDAIRALDLKHHLIDKNLAAATNNLAGEIPDFADVMAPDLSLAELRENWTRLIKNEKRKGKTEQRGAVISELSKVRFEHHGYYTLKPIYQVLRGIGTSLDVINRDRKIKHQMKVNDKFVVDTATRIITNSLNAKISAVDKYDLAAAIALATGRRRTEIFKTARFTVYPSTKSGQLEFDGQLKTKDRKTLNAADVLAYQIPCLIDRDLLLNGVELLRQVQKTDTVAYLNARGQRIDAAVIGEYMDDQYHTAAVGQFYASSANKAMKAIFNNPSVEFRLSRDIYSAIAYPTFKLDGEGQSAFRTRVYGHAEGKSSTQLSYEKIEITTKIDDIDFISDEPDHNTVNNTEVLASMAACDQMIDDYKRSPKAKIFHSWLKKQLAAGVPASEVTAGWIRARLIIPGVKSLNFKSIQAYLDKIDWLEIAKLEQPINNDESKDNTDELDDDLPCDASDDDSNDDQGEADEPTEPEPVKPAFGAQKIDDGEYAVTITYPDHVFTVVLAENSKMAAMRLAWDKYQARIELDKSKVTMRQYQKSGIYTGQMVAGNNVLVEVICGGTKSENAAEVQAAFNEQFGVITR